MKPIWKAHWWYDGLQEPYRFGILLFMLLPMISITAFENLTIAVVATLVMGLIGLSRIEYLKIKESVVKTAWIKDELWKIVQHK